MINTCAGLIRYLICFLNFVIPAQARNQLSENGATFELNAWILALGFELTDRYLKRAGLDYWEWCSWEHIEDAESFLEVRDPNTAHLLTTHEHRHYTQRIARINTYFSELTALS